MTLAANRSEPSGLSGTDASGRPAPLAAPSSKLSGLSGQVSPGHQHEALGQQAVADPALRSRQCSSSGVGMSQPLTWEKNGVLVPAPSENPGLPSCFDTPETLGAYSKRRISKLRGMLIMFSVSLDLFVYLCKNSR